MSYIDLKNSSAGRLVSKIGFKLRSPESGEGDISPENWTQSIIRLAIIFVVGIVIIEGVVNNAGLNNSSEPLYALMQSVQSNLTSGYTLASLSIMILGAGAITHYLGFI